jgi:hypothetical protein
VVGDGDLADVVQVRTAGQRAQAVLVEAEPQPELDGDLGGAFRVTVRIAVLHLDGSYERLQRFGIALDDVGHRVAFERAREHLVDRARAAVPDEHRVDRAGETGEQEAVVVPPREPPQLADAEGQQRGH